MRKSIESMVTACKEKQTMLRLTAATTVMTVVPAMSALASESAGGVSGKSLLEGELLTNVQQGIADVQFTGMQIVGLVVVAGITLVGVSAAANFVIKKIKGILSKAG